MKEMLNKEMVKKIVEADPGVDPEWHESQGDGWGGNSEERRAYGLGLTYEYEGELYTVNYMLREDFDPRTDTDLSDAYYYEYPTSILKDCEVVFDGFKEIVLTTGTHDGDQFPEVKESLEEALKCAWDEWENGSEIAFVQTFYKTGEEGRWTDDTLVDEHLMIGAGDEVLVWQDHDNNFRLMKTLDDIKKALKEELDPEESYYWPSRVYDLDHHEVAEIVCLEDYKAEDLGDEFDERIMDFGDYVLMLDVERGAVYRRGKRVQMLV